MRQPFETSSGISFTEPSIPGRLKGDGVRASVKGHVLGWTVWHAVASLKRIFE